MAYNTTFLALTPAALIIAAKYLFKIDEENIDFGVLPSSLITFYRLNKTRIKIFKRTRRQSLKVCFEDGITRYFDLDSKYKRTIFWDLWCIHIKELNSIRRIWPFTSSLELNKTASFDYDYETQIVNETVYKSNSKLQWIDKYLYLGTKRAMEDMNRSVAIPGLGSIQDIKLMYLQSPYWD